MNRKLKIKNINDSIIDTFSNLKPQSKSTYKINLKRIKVLVGDKNLFNLFSIRKALTKEPIPLSTLKIYLFIILRIYIYYFGNDLKTKKLKKYASQLGEKIIKIQQYACTIKEIERYREIKDHIKEKIKIKNKIISIPIRDLITMYLYTNIVARRLDPRFLRIYKNINTTNKTPQFPYINIKQKKMYFPRYKSGEEIIINLTSHKDFLNRLSRLQLYENNKLYRSVLSNSNGLNQINNSHKAYSVYIKSIFKKYYGVEYTSNKLRRLESSSDILSKKSIKHIKNKSKEQGHNLLTHINTYGQIENLE